MPSLFSFASLLFAAQVLATSKPPRCKEVTFTVSGSANNLNISSIIGTNLTLTLPPLVNTSLPLIPVSGTQQLAGWYCDPINWNSNSSKLQVFRGSFFTNRESWTALGGTALFNPPLQPYQPEMYSWFDYANKLGYPTVAIDTLGDGLSSRPDPILVAQIPYQLSIYHNLVQQIRSGTTGQLPRKYSTLIHVGNSLGSTIGSQMAVYYPKDFDLFVLTGFSIDVISSLPGVSLNAPAPAAVVNSTRFAGEPLGYVTSTIEQSLTNSFFGDPKYVDFDPVVAKLFFQRRDVVSLGDVVTTYLLNGIPPALTYKGRVLVLTGEHDQAYCGLGSSALDPNNNVCPALLKSTKTLFPIADYNYQIIPRTGHAIVFHKTSQLTFKVAHDFIAGKSFGK